MSVIQSTHPEWLGNHPWILPLSLVFFGVSLLLWLAQYPWFQRILGYPQWRSGADGDTPVAKGNSASATGGSSTNTITINTSAPSDKELEEKIKAIVSQYGGSRVVINSMLDNDPRIYLDIQPPTDLRDRIMCHNQGLDTAHNVQIQPLKLAGHTVKFSSIGAIGPDQKGIAAISAEGAGALTAGSLFHWLMQDWDKANQVVGKWPVAMTVKYSNGLNTREFTGTSTLEFYPLTYQMLSAYDPGRLEREKTWDFKNPQFRADRI